MNKGVKIAIGVATIGFVGTGLYFLWKKVIQPKVEKNKRDKQQLPPDDEDESSVSNNIQKAPTTNANKVPFTNSTEGNAFRKWVNAEYPDYAKQISLDPTGSYNNAYITKAWKKYGTEYQKDIADAKAKADKIANEIKIGDYVMTNKTGLNTSKQLTYNGCSQFKGRNYAIPNNVKFVVCKISRDATNGKKMINMYNSGYKKTKYYPSGMGFMVYADYMKKVQFYED